MKKRLSRRKRLLNWYNWKSKALSAIDLCTGDYMRFVYTVRRRLGNDDLTFKQCIKVATDEELCDLEITRDELRLGI